jgi:hypothetical protein
MRAYKYSAWGMTKGNYIRQNVLESVIFFASPESFNDPFDFNPVRTLPDVRCESRRHRPSSGDGDAIACQVRNLMRQDLGVCCFTTNPRTPAMWAHYADSHSGICLAYDFPDGADVVTFPPGVRQVAPLLLHKVVYNTERPVAQFFSDSGIAADNLYRSVLTKSPDWDYEDELRLIAPGYTGKAFYDPVCLTGIILGYKMPPAEREGVQKFIHAMRVKPRLYVAEINKHKFNYDIIPYTSEM